MHNHKPIYNIFGIALFFCVLVMNAKVFALDVNDMRFGVHSDKNRIVLDLTRNSDFRVFTLENPYRLVIDLESFNWRANTSQTDFKKASVSALRHGNLNADISRIVLDLNAPVNIQTAFMLPPQQNKPYRLVVDYRPVQPHEFILSNDNTHGTLGEQTVAVRPRDNLNSSYVGKDTAEAFPPRKPRHTAKPLIVIDAGHGGVDPGAVAANGIYEKHIALKLAKELKQELESTGRYRVELTRETDVFIKLADRVKFARDRNADLFISMHADSLNRKSVRGASVYTLSEKASDAQTAKLAARENQADLIGGIDLSVEDEDVANILVDLARRDTMNQSKFFANKLVSTMQTQNVNLLEKPHRYAGFAVLKAPDIPSVLVEAGFLSNQKEAELLNTKNHRRKIISALKSGIDAYFDQTLKNQRI